MCTVAELIDRLQQMPQDAVVRVKREYIHGYSIMTEHAPVDIGYGVELYDYSSEACVAKYPSMKGAKFVDLDAD
jgi:hypothetical protein